MKSYDNSKKSNFISYLDMNNLYGKAMCDVLPEHIIGYVNDTTFDEIIKTPDDAEFGYFVKCNIKIPDDMKEKTKGYPLFPETSTVNESWISDYQKSILEQNNKKFNKTSKKLLLTLYDKTDYICHYRYLKFALSIGFKADCFSVKEVIKFKQSKWLKSYIDMNTALRTKATNNFEKDYFKLMNNIIYGKTNENILNRTDLRIVSDENAAIKAFTKDNFKSADYCDGMYYVLADKEKCKYDRPIYVGCAVLDLSKVYMAEFYYNYMQKKYNNKMELIYTDTDSFVFDIETEDLYKDMWENKHLFDLSDSKNEQYHSNENKKVVGMMKCETELKPIQEFIALCPKSYSFLLDGENDKHIKSKGVTKSYVKKNVTHMDYNECLQTGVQTIGEQMTIRAFKHQIYTYKFDKVILSCYDDKCYRIDKNTGHVYGY
jgi:hypothetical protein